MKDADDAHNSATPQPDSTTSGVGGVEAAGETTADEMIGDAPDTRPVGVDTIANIKVPDTPKPTGDD